MIKLLKLNHNSHLTELSQVLPSFSTNQTLPQNVLLTFPEINSLEYTTQSWAKTHPHSVVLTATKSNSFEYTLHSTRQRRFLPLRVLLTFSERYSFE